MNQDMPQTFKWLNVMCNYIFICQIHWIFQIWWKINWIYSFYHLKIMLKRIEKENSFWGIFCYFFAILNLSYTRDTMLKFLNPSTFILPKHSNFGTMTSDFPTTTMSDDQLIWNIFTWKKRTNVNFNCFLIFHGI